MCPCISHAVPAPPRPAPAPFPPPPTQPPTPLTNSLGNCRASFDSSVVSLAVLLSLWVPRPPPSTCHHQSVIHSVSLSWVQQALLNESVSPQLDSQLLSLGLRARMEICFLFWSRQKQGPGGAGPGSECTSCSVPFPRSSGCFWGLMMLGLGQATGSQAPPPPPVSQQEGGQARAKSWFFQVL